MESQYSRRPIVSNAGCGNTISSLFDSQLPTHQPLIPRLKRYINEIGEITSKVLKTEDEKDVRTCEAEIIEAEQYLTIQGLRRQLIQRDVVISKLEETNTLLQKRAQDAEVIPKFQGQIASLAAEKTMLVQTNEALQQSIETQKEEHSKRYNDLHSLFQQLDTKFNEIINLCDKRRIETEQLEIERDSWKDKAEAYELQMKQNAEDFEKLLESEVQRSDYLVKEKDELKKQLISANKNGKQEVDEQRYQYQKEIERMKTEHLQLLNDMESLQKELQESSHMIEENKKFAIRKAEIQSELSSLRENRKELIILQQKYKETEIALKGAKQRVSELQHASSESSATQFELIQLKTKLHQWKDATAVLTKDVSGVDPTPNRLRHYIQHNEKYKRDVLQEIQQLREINSDLSRREAISRSELTLHEIELSEQRVRRESAEREVAVLFGQVKCQNDLLSKLKRDQTIESEIDEKASEDENICNGFRSTERLQEIIEKYNGEKEQYLNLIQQLRHEVEGLLNEKGLLLQQLEISLLQFKQLEQVSKFEEFHQIKLELDETRRFLAEQKDKIESQAAKVENLKDSMQYKQMEALKKQNHELEKRLTNTHKWYMNELVTFRAIVKSLLGWYIRIDRNHSGDKLIITISPTLTEKFYDEETYLIVTAHLGSIPKPLAELPSEQIENFIWSYFKHEDFELSVAGRYSDKWESLNEQFVCRQSYPVLLAVMILEDHNRVMQLTSSSTVRQIQQCQEEQ